MGGGHVAAAPCHDVVAVEGEGASGRDAGVELAQRASGGVARVHVGALPFAQLLFVEGGEFVEGKKCLTPYHEG